MITLSDMQYISINDRF